MPTKLALALSTLFVVACSGATPDPAAGPATGPQVSETPAPSTTPDAGAQTDASKKVGGESVALVQSCTLPVGNRRDPATLIEDLVYASPGGAPQTLDIMQPKTPGPHPLVVLIHGGGWAKGDKAMMRPIGGPLTTLGYTVALLNYRLVQDSGANPFPAQTSDVRCAVRWLRANAATYGIDPTRVASLGTSAGAHLSAMLGVGDGVAGLDDGTCPAALAPQSVAVRAAVGFYTPTDFRDASVWMNNADQGAGVMGLLGGPIGADPALAALASPVTHVSSASAPFFLAHGTADETVPVAQSETFTTALRAAGADATLVTLQDAPHAFPVLSDQLPLTSCTTLAFLQKYLTP